MVNLASGAGHRGARPRQWIGAHASTQPPSSSAAQDAALLAWCCGRSSRPRPAHEKPPFSAGSRFALGGAMKLSGFALVRTGALALILAMSTAGCEDTEEPPIAPATSRDGATADAGDAARSDVDGKVDAGSDDAGLAGI